MSYLLLLNLLLALLWVGLSGIHHPINFLVGLLFGYGAIIVAQPMLGPSLYVRRSAGAVGFVFFVLWEVFIANLRVARHVLSPLYRMQPRVVALPLDAKTDFEITVLANLISLTPGTLSLDLSDDRGTLYIHAMDAPDPEALRREIKEKFERRILFLLRDEPEEASP